MNLPLKCAATGLTDEENENAAGRFSRCGATSVLHKRMKTVQAGSSHSKTRLVVGTDRDQLLLQVKGAVRPPLT